MRPDTVLLPAQADCPVESTPLLVQLCKDRAVSSRVVMYIRQGCHLCEVALATAREVCAETGEDVTTIDIDTDPELVRQWNDQVPVTLVDGRQHDFWRVDPVRLRAALAGGTGETA